MLGIRVELAGDHARDSCGEERVDAWWRGAVVRARFEGEVDGGASRPLTRRLERDHLGVRPALPFVPALADDLAVGDDNRPDDRIRVRRAATLLGELERALQPIRLHGRDPRVVRTLPVVELPRALVETWGHERHWLDELPQLVGECAAQWSLELEAAIETPYSLVIPAGDTVLKLIAPSDDDARHEGEALALWRGQGAVRLLGRDDERGALLIERCVPGTRLWDGGVDEIDVIAALIPRLQIDVEEPTPVPLLADEADRWAEEVPRRYAEAGEPFERALLEAAMDVYGTVDRSARWLVNQDLHGANVLNAAREPWLVIDPKPLVGERELEASAPLRNTADVSRWLDALADLGFDRERARGWGVAHNLAWAWDERRGWLDVHVAEARRILTAR